MATFMTAYLTVWLAVVLYVGRIGLRQRTLHRELDMLQQRLQHDDCEPPAQAA